MFRFLNARVSNHKLNLLNEIICDKIMLLTSSKVFKMEKAIIYARVSSKDQENEGFSIPSQLKLLTAYAMKHNFKVVYEFTDVETAKKAGRTEFNKMLNLLEQDRNIKHVLVEKTDRLLRNFFDSAQIVNLIEKLSIQVHLVKENRILTQDSKANEKLAFGLNVLLSKHYVDNLSEEVKKGMTEKASQGIYPSIVCYGYLNVRENGKSIIKIDPIAASYIKRIYDLYSTGKISLLNLAKKMIAEGMIYKNGKKIYTSTIENILKNEFYTGIFYWKGKKYENATHEPIISKEQFQRIQSVLRNPNKIKSRKDLYPYTNFIKCGNCGCALTAEIKKNKYIYYHCTNFKGICKKEYVRQEELENQFATLLEQIQITDEVKDIVLEAMRESLKDKIEYHTKLVEGLEQQIKVLQRRIDQSYLDKLDGKISEEFWQSNTRKWMLEKEELSLKLVAAHKADSHYLENAHFILELAKNASTWFKEGNPEKKRRVLDTLISNCTYKDRNIDVELHSVFAVIFESKKTEEWCAQEESNPQPSDP